MAGRAASTTADRETSTIAGRAAPIITNSGIHGVNTAADLARLRGEGKHLNPQELKELTARVKSLEEMARLENRLKLLERREQPHSNEDPDVSEDLENEVRNPRAPTNDDNSGTGNLSLIRHSTEIDTSNSSSSESDDQHRHKRRRYNKGFKVTPNCTLRTSSSLREWGDWKREIERVFEGDPDTYQHGSQKIVKALDYLDWSLKSLWYTYSEQAGGIRKWQHFIKWTRQNVQNGQNATATLYEQLERAKQLPDKSPVKFNAYLASIERDLPQQTEQASAMTFYSKLSGELKKQFKSSDIQIPETRAQCVATAQRIWEGLHSPEEQRPNFGNGNSKGFSSGPRYPRFDSRRDRKDRFLRSHRGPDDQNKPWTEHRNDQNRIRDNRSRDQSKKEQPTCFTCNKPGHLSPNCPERKKAKIQSVQEGIDGQRSSHSDSKTTDSETDDSLN